MPHMADDSFGQELRPARLEMGSTVLRLGEFSNFLSETVPVLGRVLDGAVGNHAMLPSSRRNKSTSVLFGEERILGVGC